MPLSQLVTFEEIAVAAELDRHGQRRAIEIDGGLADGFTLRQAVEAVRALAHKELPASVGLLFLNEAAELEETSRDLAITYMIAILVVFLVLVAQFESLTSAAIVILTVPFGICAAVFALALTGTTINIYSQIGVLMLIGIMAKNSILMVEFADQLRETGAGARSRARGLAGAPAADRDDHDVHRAGRPAADSRRGPVRKHEPPSAGWCSAGLGLLEASR